MYEIFYKLSAEPFRLSPDPRFCFEHRTYRKAMTYMRHGLHRAEGFIMITGRPGTGKTTLINDLLRTLKSDQVMVANLITTQLTADNLLRLVAYSFNLDPGGADKIGVLMQVGRFLKQQHRQGQRPLLIVDEAQGLPEEALEELRQLTNIQVGNQQLLQIFLVGQEQLRDIVNTPSMEQLRQRMIAATHLEPLDRDDTEAYIKHRLRSVAWTGDPLISEEAYAMIQQYSQGIPRQINQICSRLFLHGNIEEKHRLGIADVEIVIEELRQESLMPMDTSAMAEALPLAADQQSETYVEEPRRQTAPAAPASVQQPTPKTTETSQKTEPARQESTRATPATPPSMPENKPAAEASPATSNIPNLEQQAVSTTWLQKNPPANMAASLENSAGKRPAANPDARTLNKAKSRFMKARKLSSWGLLGLTWLITGLALAFMYMANPELTRQTGKNLVTWTQSGIQKGVSFASGESSPGITAAADDLGGAVVREPPPPIHEPATEATEIEPAVQEPVPELPPVIPLQLSDELRQKGLLVERKDDDILKVNLSSDGIFAFDSIQIKDGARPALENLADVLRQHDKITIHVVGHTDSFGTAEYNLQLSQQRAEAIADYLVKQGLTESSILSEGRGDKDTSLEQSGTYDPSLKRRVEIYIMQAQVM